MISEILRALGAKNVSHTRNPRDLADQGLNLPDMVPHSFYGGAGIGDVPIVPFTPDEADALADKMPNLRPLLFGAASVREIARRPFFAAVLARSFPDGTPSPRTEVDLSRRGGTARVTMRPQEAVPLRQRASSILPSAGFAIWARRYPPA